MQTRWLALFPALEILLHNYGATVSFLNQQILEKERNVGQAKELLKKMLNVHSFLLLRQMHAMFNQMYQLSLKMQQRHLSIEAGMEALKVIIFQKHVIWSKLHAYMSRDVIIYVNINMKHMKWWQWDFICQICLLQMLLRVFLQELSPSYYVGSKRWDQEGICGRWFRSTIEWRPHLCVSLSKNHPKYTYRPTSLRGWNADVWCWARKHLSIVDQRA